MNLTFGPRQRALVTGAVAVAVLVGAYAVGSAQANGTPVSYTTPVTVPSGGTANPANVALTASSTGITVTGMGNASGTPDQLLVNLGVQVHGMSVTAALDDANRAVNRISGALRAHGVSAADIQTAGLSVQPRYTSGISTDGYDVSETLTAKLRDLAKAGDAISSAAQAGGNATRIDGVSLNLDAASGLLASARSAAMTDAKTKAEQYAKAAGRGLGPVVSVQETTASPAPVFDQKATASAGSSQVPISPGTQQLSVTVTVVYALT
jgi:uncharacterized protein YggE